MPSEKTFKDNVKKSNQAKGVRDASVYKVKDVKTRADVVLRLQDAQGVNTKINLDCADSVCLKK